IDNWGKCDDFCTHAFGYLFMQYPEKISNTKKWAKSKNRWLRRASAVIYIYPNRQNKYINEAFVISDILLEDQDDLVQKGYGWMLKEISNLYPDKVFKYVTKNKAKMPRTALRYAIEKLPPKKREQAMKK
ncbi:MAG: DNA alkylation repair protein, partial [Patescibacteria group bacterium]